jgi:hypothetical protein
MLDKKHLNLSVRRQSELLNLNRSTLYYKKVVGEEEFELANIVSEV